jgi:sugar porter (SP) family MFS transporter
MALEDKLIGPALKFSTFLDKFPKVYNVYVIAMISCISGMMFGIDISSMSVFVSDKDYLSFFNSQNSELQGFITSSMALGSFFGAISASFVSEPFGRRPSLMTCGFFWVVGSAIQSSSQNVAQLIIGRIIGGYGVGFGSSVAPVYGSEMSPRKIRGLIGGLFQFSVTLGILIMYFVSYGCHFINGVGSFRIAWGVQMVPGLLIILGTFFIPESPRWLAKQNLWDQAENIVAEVQAKGDREDPDVIIEVCEIKEQIFASEKLRSFTFADLFTKKYISRTIVAVSAQIWQQLAGLNVMNYYVVYIFEMAGYSGNNNLIASCIQYCLKVGVTGVALLFMDKFGRRPLLLFGAAGMMVWQYAVAGLFATYAVQIENPDNDTVRMRIPLDQKAVGKAIIASCFLFVCCYAGTWGVTIWVYCAEVWGDNAARQRGAAISTAANWIFNFALAMYTPSSFKNITWKTYIIYATFCACMFIHVFFFFSETKGKRLEELGLMWQEKVPAWRSRLWQPDVPFLSDKELHSKMEIEHFEGERNSENSHASQSLENK